jgi:ketosteroid isomerase-like protein
MPQENVEIVRAAYPAFNRRDWDQVFSEADPEIELTVEGLPDDPGTRRGRKAAQARLERSARSVGRVVLRTGRPS